MIYQSPYKSFIFESYSFNPNTATAEFNYSFDGERHFSESLVMASPAGNNIDNELLNSALELSFYLAGISYYKAFPTQEFIFKVAQPDEAQAEFLQTVYTKGLSQFLFENGLSAESVAQFPGGGRSGTPIKYEGSGDLVLQSGGKDSLLLATILEERGAAYTPWYISSGSKYPAVLDELIFPLQTVRRELDSGALLKAARDGGMNGHIPVTYIVLSYGLLAAIVQNNKSVLAAIGREGEEPHEYIGDLPVNHQWSKTWEAEKLFAWYVDSYISSDLQVGSPLRGLSELRIAELFVEKCWAKYGSKFSSCNRANYQQGTDNTHLQWCGECPKCANSYLLFSPFVDPTSLQQLFGGEDLFAKTNLVQVFKGLLGIDGVMKPFECVGETGELRLAYHMAQERYGDINYQLPFEVPASQFDYMRHGDSQDWASGIVL